MAFPDQLLCPISDLHVRFRRPITRKYAGFPIHLTSKPFRNGIATVKNGNKLKRALRLSFSGRRETASSSKKWELVEFLYKDLPHLFDEHGIDRTMYDGRVRFCDSITKHDSIDGYLFNIRLLKLLFGTNFRLHHVKQDLWDPIEDNDYFSLEDLWDVIRQLRIYRTPDLESPKYQILKRTASY